MIKSLIAAAVLTTMATAAGAQTNVVDARGKALGAYAPPNSAIMRIEGRNYVLSFLPDPNGTNTLNLEPAVPYGIKPDHFNKEIPIFIYATTDCSGVAYTRVQYAPADALYDGTNIWYAGLPLSYQTIRSGKLMNGFCSSSPSTMALPVGDPLLVGLAKAITLGALGFKAPLTVRQGGEND